MHEYWEGVFLVSGDLVVGNDANGNGGKSFPPNTYAFRPPGAYHGPFKSNSGCVLLEVHYFTRLNRHVYHQGKRDVRYWHLADIAQCTAHVCF